MRLLQGSVVEEKELSREAKLSIYLSVYFPSLIYGDVLWVVTGIMRSWSRNEVCSAVSEPPHPGGTRSRAAALPRGEESAEVVLVHPIRMPPSRLPLEVFTRPTGRRPRCRWTDVQTMTCGPYS